MKKAVIILMVLVLVFTGTWIFKDKSPKIRVDAAAVNGETVWWTTKPNEKPVASDDWTIDPEIPENYVPVPGQDELYMEIGEDGKILHYRHRTKQADGSWIWETVNPDIPEGYEPVEGLENVYKVTDENGNVIYVKYIRNDDDTYTFVQCDSNGNIIDVKAEDNSKGIPSNYVRVSGNIYAVYDEHGVLIGYKERVQNSDGSYSWIDAEKPEENNQEESSSTVYVPDVSQPEMSVPEPIETSRPSIRVPENSQGSMPENSGSESSQSSGPVVVVIPDDQTSTDKPKQNYTTTDTYTTTETAGGWTITYETVVYKTYDGDGVLISTKKVGPTEVSRVRVGNTDNKTPDRTRIESTLNNELTRVSKDVVYNDELANEVYGKLNAERSLHGIPTMKMTNTGTAYKVARLIAADMAIYDHSDINSPMYGSLNELLQRYSIQTKGASEYLWKATQASAQEIHARFQADNYANRMNESFSEVGIAIVSKNGYYYICEIYLG